MEILGVRIDQITKAEALEKIEQFLRNGEPKQIATVGPEFILKAQEDKEFKDILNNCDLNVADTAGTLWAATFLNKKLTKIKVLRTLQAIWQYKITGAAIVFNPKHIQNILPERIPGADFFWDLIELANDRSENIFLLGGRNGVAEKSAKAIKSKYPNLDIGYSEADPDNDGVIKEIKDSKIGILFVAYGAPKQEKWLAKNLKNSGAKIGIGVGGTFDFVSGKIKRAPRPIRSIGLEWLWRLILQPSRIGRIYNAFIKFSLTILMGKLKNSLH